MKKKYTIEVPMYAYTLEELTSFMQNPDIQIVLYGGAPDSPLNGGRFNYTIDGYQNFSPFSYRITQKQLDKLNKHFSKSISDFNKNNMPFYLVFTNLFVNESELTEKNLSPVECLIENSQKFHIKNGVIINNKSLEQLLREKYDEKLTYISSCTKYVAPERILNEDESIQMYIQDSILYDYVVLTPQHSRKKQIIEKVMANTKGNVITIVNSYCADECNSYYHYVHVSKENKKSLLAIKFKDVLKSACNVLEKRSSKCTLIRHPFKKIKVKEIAQMQIAVGIKNFKIGRGLGANCIETIIPLLKKE